MTNREKFKGEIDEILLPLMAVVNGKPVICDDASCRECLFTKNCGKNEHKQEIIDWLNAEYQEPPVDWSKVPIDTPVLVSIDGEHWIRQYFAGIGDDGTPETFHAGATSWSNCIIDHCYYKYIKLAEGNECPGSMYSQRREE